MNKLNAQSSWPNASILVADSANNFSDIQVGIRVRDSYVKIYDNIFENINPFNYTSRPQDNQFYNLPSGNDIRVGGGLNLHVPPIPPKWHFRDVQNYKPNITNGSSDHFQIEMVPLINCSAGSQYLYANIEDTDFSLYKEKLYKNIAIDSNEYNEFEYNFKFSDKEYLYNTLYYNPSMINTFNEDDSIYYQFLDNNSDIQTLIDINELIQYNNIYGAIEENENINTDSLIMLNRYYVNDVYLHSFALNTELTEEQESSLYQIASMPETIGGDAVYSARVMLGYNPLSNPNNERNYHVSNPIISKNSVNKVKVYPNPATDILTIEFEEELENIAVFCLYDLSGREIICKTLNEKTAIFNINISSLNNGIYIYKIDLEEDVNGKIIVNH